MGVYDKAIEACKKNATRLYEVSRDLPVSGHPEAGFQLAILAQEECAKTFLLTLINEYILPWTREVERAMRSHECKHLVGIIMWYLNPSDEEVWRRREGDRLFDGIPVVLPQRVADAINILRHEKIGRWCSRDWWWVNDPQYDVEAKNIGAGILERRKQEAVYCTVAIDGSFQQPKVDEVEAEEAIRRTRQMVDLVCGWTLGSYKEEKAVKYALKELFSSLTDGDRTAGEHLLAVGEEDVKKEMERYNRAQNSPLAEVFGRRTGDMNQ